MKSGWTAEILAIVRKEWLSEQRNRSAIFTSLMLSLTTVFTLAFAYYGRTLEGEAAAGMLWSGLLFAGVGTLARAFVAEDEQGTGDLLRMWSRPHAVFWGKSIFAFVQMAVTGFLISLVFIVLTGVEVKEPILLVVSLGGGICALAGTVTLASAMISRGSNRGTLAGVVSLPLLLPLIAMGVTSGRSAFSGSTLGAGWSASAGIWLYTVAVLAAAPHIFAEIWRES